MPDVSLVNTSVTAAPTDYKVPGTQELLVKAVRASLDGSGAAGSYLPALQLVDPAGNVMWTAVNTGTSIAAGASADVSWFPGLGGNGASASASGAWTQVFHFDVPALTVAASIDTGVVFDNTTKNIFGLFIGGTDTASHNQRVDLLFNNDSLGHYGWAYSGGDAFLGAGAFVSTGNVLDTHGSIGLVGGTGDSLGISAIQFWIPRSFPGAALPFGKLSATGGYAGVVSGDHHTAVTSYEFTQITRLKLFPGGGGNFVAGTSLTLWTV